MSFVEIRFPEDIAFGSEGGPQFSTDVVTTQGGFEQRNSNWQAARARYNVARGIKTQAQLESLLAFFRARKGRAIGFRFKDWADYSAMGQILGEGNGSKQDFQLIKNYTSGATTVSRSITKPVAGSVAVYVNSVLQTSGYTLNTVTGAISFTTAPAALAVVSADFEFDIPVRFDADSIAASLEAYGAFTVLEISLIEVRV